MIQNLVLLLSLVSLNLHRIEIIDKSTIVLQARIESLERLFEDLNAKLAVNETSKTAAKQRKTTVKTTEIAADEKDTMTTSAYSVSEKSTEPIITTQIKVKEVEVTAREVSCDIAFNGTCYWYHVEDGWNVNFTRAEEICSNNASILAYFPNETVYNSVVEDLRSKIPTRRSWVAVWTGVTIDTNTGDVTHASEDTYVKWYPTYPRTGSSYETQAHVALIVSSDPDAIYQGMLNRELRWIRNGVVCQTTIG